MADNGNVALSNLSRSSNNQGQDQAQEFGGANVIMSALSAHNGPQGSMNRVHFQDENNEGSMNVSDHLPDEEAHDIVHDLQGEVPASATLAQTGDISSGIAVSGQDLTMQQRRRASSNQNVNRPQPPGSGFRSKENEGKIQFQNLEEGDDINDFSNVQEMQEEDASFSVTRTVKVTPYEVNMEASYDEFNTHVVECNIDFKERIIRQVQTMKLRDTNELNQAVEELKAQEAIELGQLNKNYQKLDLRSKKLDRKNDRLEIIIEAWIEQWRIKKLKKKLYTFLKIYASTKAREHRQINYCDDFYLAGLMRRGLKGIKLFTQMAGNRLYKRRVEEKVVGEVNDMVVEKKNQLEFLEGMIKELEEKYRIELRKKAILKSQCDQAYLRGVSAISMEALKMSHSTLSDYYKGMKMPNYDGQNIFAQMRSLNGAGAAFQEIGEMQMQQQQQQQQVTVTKTMTTTQQQMN